MNTKTHKKLFTFIMSSLIIIVFIVLCKSTKELFTNKYNAFCENQTGKISKCETLTQKNCNKTSCCVWLNNNQSDNKCVKGNKNGPTFNTDKNGKKSSYYFMNKCYGDNC